MDSLASTAEAIRSELDAKNVARDKALVTSREAIRHSANAIRAIHRGDFGEAETLLAGARDRVRETREELVEFPDIYHAGYVQDAQKEYAEAALVNAFIRDLPMPSHHSLEIESAPFLNGIAEAVSECRRDILDLLRSGNTSRAEELMSVIDEVFYVLYSFDYPDAITGGLRRTMDQARAVLERTRGDLTVTVRQQELEKALNNAASLFNR